MTTIWKNSAVTAVPSCENERMCVSDIVVVGGWCILIATVSC